MPRIIKFILFLILFGIVFELGLLSSYTIVTSQPPDVGKLVDMQVSKLTAIWDSVTTGSDKNTTKGYNVTNQNDVANALIQRTGLNGINVDTLSATTGDSGTNNLNVTLSATGYKENQTGTVTSTTKSSNFTSGQIVIKQSEIYSITATALGTKKSKGIEINPGTIQVTALKKLYNQ
ncbi:MAG TPA: hypothetical protein VK426_05310 [Methanobacterium sp.]|nr:hypothetical protein [Methanobacterium sp.]